jgi:hypothetical protein
MTWLDGAETNRTIEDRVGGADRRSTAEREKSGFPPV